MKMKAYIATGILAAALLASGCGKFVRDELITMQNEIDKLYKQVELMNEGLETLQTIIYEMGARGYIVGVEEGKDEDGRAYYKLKFRTITPDADGRGYEMTDDKDPVLLYTGVDGKDGEDAEPYVVSAKQDEEDGRWYWYSTQDEDWLKDSYGNRFSVDGKTPQLKVEEGFWFLSWDDGQTWEETGWKAKGEDAYEMFTKVEVFDDRVELTLAADGSVLVLPRFLPVDVVLTVEGQNPDKDIMIYPGETISVHYVLSGTGVADAILVAGTDGRLKTSIQEDSATEGTVYVTCPEMEVEDFPKGSYVSITVNDGNGRSDVRILRFACRSFEFLLGDREHTAPAAGETGVKLSFTADFDLDIICVEPWLTVNTETVGNVFGLTYDVAANDSAEARTGVIAVSPKGNPNFKIVLTTVNQAKAETAEPGV